MTSCSVLVNIHKKTYVGVGLFFTDNAFHVLKNFGNCGILRLEIITANKEEII